MKPKTKITIPDVLDRFKAYYEKNPAWGSLHIVLSDHNVADPHVKSCIQLAQKNADSEGEELGKILLKMTKSQRLRLPYKV